ncbi:MAG: hypothetical protein ABFD89_05275 [Bryobacteraceae bacterium]
MNDSITRLANTIRRLDQKLKEAMSSGDEESAARASNAINGIVWASQELLSVEDFQALTAAAGLSSLDTGLCINIINFDVSP